jgi:hypothetical protein
MEDWIAEVIVEQEPVTWFTRTTAYGITQLHGTAQPVLSENGLEGVTDQRSNSHVGNVYDMRGLVRLPDFEQSGPAHSSLNSDIGSGIKYASSATDREFRNLVVGHIRLAVVLLVVLRTGRSKFAKACVVALVLRARDRSPATDKRQSGIDFIRPVQRLYYELVRLPVVMAEQPGFSVPLMLLNRFEPKVPEQSSQLLLGTNICPWHRATNLFNEFLLFVIQHGGSMADSGFVDFVG